MGLPRGTITWKAGESVNPARPLFIKEGAFRHWEEWTMWYPEIAELITSTADSARKLFLTKKERNDQVLLYPLEIVDTKTFATIKARILHSKGSSYDYSHYVVQVGKRQAVVCCGTSSSKPSEFRVYATY